ncbi:ABC transporter ATP-binding protein [uncultured Vagococcus sp.]|uniref:ABC transporter ATP-binding protein n=1 Tax=uncultured Vagococcus sp. TaxID=189676 RepID=UPI0028D60A8C|nr:ABC transporter ATP-binding protein [uncultured Vagococcus sp.]
MHHVYRYFLKKYVLEEKIYFTLVCLTTFTQSFLTMCIPLVYQRLLDKVFPQKDIQQFWLMIIIMLVCFLGTSILNVCKDFLLARIAENITKTLRIELNQKISLMKYSYFDDHSLNSVLSKFNREVEIIKENCGYMLVKTLSNAVTFIMAAFMIIRMEWRVILISCVLLTVYVMNNKFWGKRIKDLAEKSMEGNEKSLGALSENYKNVLITKLYSAYQYVNEKFDNAYKRQYKLQMALEVNYSMNLNIGGLLNYLLSGGIWLIGGIGIFAGRLTIGTVTALINYQSMLIGPLTFFSEFNNSYQSVLIAMKRLLSVLAYEEESDEGHDISDEPVNHLQFTDVAFKYTKSDTILENINLNIQKGKMYAFIGGSGCGKSTLVKLLLGLYPPADGVIHVNAHDMANLSLKSIRGKIAFVAQDSLFYEGSVLENLTMGNQVDSSQMIRLSKLLDVYEDIMRLPKQWETELSSGGNNLSGGQKKRLDILRALLRESDVIIFDESTASIDLERRNKLFDILKKLKGEKIIICITHNLEECTHFDQVFGVKDKHVFPITTDYLLKAY